MRELSLNVMDIAQNSISAGAKLIGVDVVEDAGKDELIIRITDDGKGMSEEQVRQVIDPFFTTRTTRKVGLGVPLFKMEAEMTGGGLEISSELGKGTVVTARFVPSHVGHRLHDPALDHLQSRPRFSFSPRSKRPRFYLGHPRAASCAGGGRGFGRSGCCGVDKRVLSRANKDDKGGNLNEIFS